MVTPPSVTVATQEGEAGLLVLAGALDGPAGEALSVVIAPEVSNSVIATLVSLLSSGRWDSCCPRTFNKLYQNTIKCVCG